MFHIMAIELGHTEVITMIGAVGLSIFVAYYTMFFRKKNILVRGITDVVKASDGEKFRGASGKLYKKYFENKDVEESDLHKAAEQIRIGLIVVQGLIESNMLKKNRVYEIYSDTIVKAVDSYQKYLDEYEPNYVGLDIPIQMIYNKSQQWIKEKKLLKSVTK